MKGYLSIAAAIGICLMLKKARPIRAHAWFTRTHEAITEGAFELLEKENKPKVAAFYKNYHAELLKGCSAPDKEGDRRALLFLRKRKGQGASAAGGLLSEPLGRLLKERTLYA